MRPASRPVTTAVVPETLHPVKTEAAAAPLQPDSTPASALNNSKPPANNADHAVDGVTGTGPSGKLTTAAKADPDAGASPTAADGADDEPSVTAKDKDGASSSTSGSSSSSDSGSSKSSKSQSFQTNGQ